MGARNKKIYSVNVNKYGLVAAGNDKGEILLWELDVKAFKKSSSNVNPSNISRFIGSFKCYKNAVHFCEFSPNGLQLFTGSDDGTAIIWKIDKGKVAPSLSDEKLLVTL